MNHGRHGRARKKAHSVLERGLRKPRPKPKKVFSVSSVSSVVHSLGVPAFGNMCPMEKSRANYAPLTPVSFLRRSAEVYPRKAAVIHGATHVHLRGSCSERVARFASALARRGIGAATRWRSWRPTCPRCSRRTTRCRGSGAVLNALNYRLDARAIAFCLDHGEAKVLVTDREFAPVVREALELVQAKPPRGRHRRPAGRGARAAGNGRPTRRFLADGDPGFDLPGPTTSGTRCACSTPRAPPAIRRGSSTTTAARYLNALGNALAFGLDARVGVPLDAADVPLQRLDLHLGGDGGRRHARVPAQGRSRR